MIASPAAGRALPREKHMAHSICITYNYCREDNTGWWVTVEDRGTEWTFDYLEGSRSGFYAIPKSAGWCSLMKECRRYMDSTAWITNFHENRRAA